MEDSSLPQIMNNTRNDHHIDHGLSTNYGMPNRNIKGRLPFKPNISKLETDILRDMSDGRLPNVNQTQLGFDLKSFSPGLSSPPTNFMFAAKKKVKGSGFMASPPNEPQNISKELLKLPWFTTQKLKKPEDLFRINHSTAQLYNSVAAETMKDFTNDITGYQTEAPTQQISPSPETVLPSAIVSRAVRNRGSNFQWRSIDL